MEIIAYWAVIILGLPLVIALLGREAYAWWSTREIRKSQKAIRQLEDEHYKKMARDAVRYAEDLYSHMGKVE